MAANIAKLVVSHRKMKLAKTALTFGVSYRIEEIMHFRCSSLTLLLHRRSFFLGVTLENGVSKHQNEKHKSVLQYYSLLLRNVKKELKIVTLKRFG